MNGHDNLIAQKLLRAFMLFKKADWHQEARAEGYKPSELRVLYCLNKGINAQHRKMRVSEISQLLHVTPPTITQLLNQLEANGLVERRVDPADRRAVHIILTEKGEAVIQEALKRFYASLDGLIQYLGEEESEQLATLLLKTFQYFNEKQSMLQ